MGQLLEYAANAVAYWPADNIREEFERRCEQDEVPSEQVFQEVFGAEVDEEEFWERVATNLSLERIRLIFVADKIRPELQRIVEYLNRQMRQTEVLAVEIRQFEGEGRQTLVPRVIGKTAVPRSVRTKEWDEGSYLARLTPSEAEVARRLLQWAKQSGFRIVGGRGPKSAGLNLILDVGGAALKSLYLYENPRALSSTSIGWGRAFLKSRSVGSSRSASTA